MRKSKNMKLSKIEYNARVEEVFEIVILGAEFADIKKYAAEKGWAITDAEALRYQAAALQLCSDRLSRNRDTAIARHIMQRRALYARAIESGDWGTALSIARDEARLLGLYDPTPETNTDAERAAAEAKIISRLAEIAERAGAAGSQRIIAQIAGGTGEEDASEIDIGIRGEKETSSGCISSEKPSGSGDRTDTADQGC